MTIEAFNSTNGDLLTAAEVAAQLDLTPARSLEGTTDPVNNITPAYFEGQIYTNTATKDTFVATTASTNPDASGAGSVWLKKSSLGVQYNHETLPISGSSFPNASAANDNLAAYSSIPFTLDTIDIKYLYSTRDSIWEPVGVSSLLRDLLSWTGLPAANTPNLRDVATTNGNAVRITNDVAGTAKRVRTQTFNLESPVEVTLVFAIGSEYSDRAFFRMTDTVTANNANHQLLLQNDNFNDSITRSGGFNNSVEILILEQNKTETQYRVKYRLTSLDNNPVHIELFPSLGSGNGVKYIDLHDLKIEPAKAHTVNYQGRVANGDGSLGSNYNFPDFEFDRVESNGNFGSFSMAQEISAVFTEEFIPVDNRKPLLLDFLAKSGDSDGGRFEPTQTHFTGIAQYDADFNLIQSNHILFFVSSLTTLAADLNPGDTTITLTDATGWQSTSALDFQRQISIYNYTNRLGYEYPAGTYTRNVSVNDTDYANNGLWAVGGITGNVITLTKPWSGDLIPAGTPVANSNQSNSFLYAALNGDTITNTWERYSGVCEPYVPGEPNVLRQWAGSAYVKLVFRLNFQTALGVNVVRLSNVSLKSVEPGLTYFGLELQTEGDTFPVIDSFNEPFYKSIGFIRTDSTPHTKWYYVPEQTAWQFEEQTDLFFGRNDEVVDVGDLFGSPWQGISSGQAIIPGAPLVGATPRVKDVTLSFRETTPAAADWQISLDLTLHGNSTALTTFNFNGPNAIGLAPNQYFRNTGLYTALPNAGPYVLRASAIVGTGLVVDDPISTLRLVWMIDA